ncbi:PmoA family protein [Candidatus Poribacteria bacterium]|nr:PmoA family protein [Candidatus Poribacteria bacterium]
MIHQINNNELSITKNSAPILTYSYGDPEKPPYFHPLYVPDGQVVTAGEYTQGQYPPGICFTLGTVNGEHLDPNTLIREREPSNGETSEDFTIVTTWNASEPLLIETCTTDVHPPQTEVQVLDIAISLFAPTTSLEFAGNIGLGCRTVEMEYRKAANANGGIGEMAVNGNRSVWGTLSGVTAAEQSVVGVGIFPHPTNGETTFLVEDVSFGYLFAQAAPFKVNVGLTRTLKYRVLAYIGDLFTVDVWKYHQDYIG